MLTGTRADYGLLRGLLRAIDADPALDLQIIATGTHLNDSFGRTASEIESDGFTVAASVPIWTEDDTRLGVAGDVGWALPLYAQALDDLDPDILVVLGDRLEAFIAATAATILSVPVAHIHGGEITEGAMDDALRHSITKMSYLHFASTEEHRRRVIQLGEEPGRVHFHGAPVVDALDALELLPRDAVAQQFGIRLSDPYALVTFHPAVMDVAAPAVLLDRLLAALLDVDGLHIVITGSNSDIGTADVRQRIADFVASHPDRVDFVESFGQLGYLSAMSSAAVVAGNSSSTVLEAPVLGIPSVLVGDRQKGRPLGSSVRSPMPTRSGIADALREAISGANPGPDAAIFGTPGFAARTTMTLRDTAIPRPPRKKFYDIEEESGE
ncbi:UDP-N-acetylglucosamine 2-epimerase [Microbacterium sp.]|uniref:UDP-N-acetylglucosamine 2-epimerase n=1 Tax=Microbacterium sp. TaxID=51671 RepID=UPI0035672793